MLSLYLWHWLRYHFIKLNFLADLLTDFLVSFALSFHVSRHLGERSICDPCRRNAILQSGSPIFFPPGNPPGNRSGNHLVRTAHMCCLHSDVWFAMWQAPRLRHKLMSQLINRRCYGSIADRVCYASIAYGGYYGSIRSERFQNSTTYGKVFFYCRGPG